MDEGIGAPLAGGRAGHAREPPGPLVRRTDPARIALVGLFTLAIFYTLYFARGILLPIFLALLLSLLLRPLVRGLKRLRVPEGIGAGLVVLLFASVIALGITRLTEPAADWLDRGPRIAARLELQLGGLRESLEEARAATQEIERLAAPAEDETAEVVVRGPSLSEQVLTQTQAILAQFAVVVVLLYFFLASGRSLVERLIGALASIEDRLRLAAVANTVQRNIAAYLSTVTLINAALGIATAVAMALLGMPNPALWGVLAALLNFVPFLGAAATAAIIAFVALLTFETPARILLPPLAFLALTALEGNFVTPMVVGRRLTLSPIAVFLAILLWGWLWGVAGALLAVPILAVFKIVCDETGALRVVGALLGDR